MVDVHGLCGGVDGVDGHRAVLGVIIGWRRSIRNDRRVGVEVDVGFGFGVFVLRGLGVDWLLRSVCGRSIIGAGCILLRTLLLMLCVLLLLVELLVGLLRRCILSLSLRWQLLFFGFRFLFLRLLLVLLLVLLLGLLLLLSVRRCLSA